jgi:clan AA aspartic protease (TIGR02281 family)
MESALMSILRTLSSHFPKIYKRDALKPWQITVWSLSFLLGVSSQSLAGDAIIPGVIGGVVGGILNNAIQQQRQQQYYQQQYYQQQQVYQQQQQLHYQQQQLELERQRANAAAQEASRRQAQGQQRQKAARDKAKKEQEEARLRMPAPIMGDDATGQLAVPMKKEGGTFQVPVRINDVVTIGFTVDSGASDVVLPKDVVMTLFRSETLKEGDYIGSQTYSLADGSKLKSDKFKLQSLQVGNHILKNIVASVAPASGGPLLGQSFLSRFSSWTIDNTAGTLILNLPGARQAPNTETIVASAPAPSRDEPKAEQPASQPTTASATSTAAKPQSAPEPTTSADPQTTSKPAARDAVKQESASQLAAPTIVGAAKADQVIAAASVPAFPSRTPYGQARKSLMALGYGPAPLPEADKCDRETDQTCFPERDSCTRGQCEFIWRRGETLVKIRTVEVPPIVSAVECEVNCRWSGIANRVRKKRPRKSQRMRSWATSRTILANLGTSMAFPIGIPVA